MNKKPLNLEKEIREENRITLRDIQTKNPSSWKKTRIEKVWTLS